MLSKRQFIALYDDTVLNIRQIKNSNDRINKNIGVLSQHSLYKQSEAEKQSIEGLIEKAENTILRMQKNYLDPDTARKIGVVRQQLRIQRDRRNQLYQKVNEITKEAKQKLQNSTINYKKAKDEQLLSHSPRRNLYKQSVAKNDDDDSSSSVSKRSQITDIQETEQAETKRTQVNMQLSDFDLQMQEKLLHQKNRQIKYAHEKMMNIKSVVDETSDLAYQQGEKIDIIGEQIFESYKNMKIANTELEEADHHHKKSKRKYVLLSLFLLIIIGVVLFMIFGM